MSDERRGWRLPKDFEINWFNGMMDHFDAMFGVESERCVCGYNPESGVRMDIWCPVHDAENPEAT